MFQTYAGRKQAELAILFHNNLIFRCKVWIVCFPEVTGVFPSKGSLLGGTLVTISGRFFDQTDEAASVLIGRNCLSL